MAWPTLAADALKSGGVRAPFAGSVEAGGPYGWSPRLRGQPSATARAFARWLKAELAADGAVCPPQSFVHRRRASCGAFRSRTRRTLHDRRGGPTASAERRARRRRVDAARPRLCGAGRRDGGADRVWPIPRSWDLVNHWARLTLYHMTPGDPLAALYQARLTLIPIWRSTSSTLALRRFFAPYRAIALAWVAAFAAARLGRVAARHGGSRRAAARSSSSRRRSPTISSSPSGC